MATYKGTTETGFEFEIDENAIDMELMDSIADAGDNEIYIGRVIGRMLGKEQKKAFYNHLREKYGNVPIDKASECLADFFNAVTAGKNC